MGRWEDKRDDDGSSLGKVGKLRNKVDRDMPYESTRTRGDVMTWTDDQLADYETALETIGNLIALASRDISKERKKSRPDVRRIDELLELQKRLSDDRRSLRIDDDAAVQEAIETYGQVVRSGDLVR
ncbi:hypothetical protein L0Z11_16210 [Burkholderia multivorans]|uniref:hypothetical protein n=2 Tax=Burkholderia multivorans TaxID=87883 RepID=UPI00201A111D|nr:hypothetical protein [Burkholderia multivorans]UQN69184.1 hypothetical protein L0Z45_16230 [Burkholderia multivorans]UQN74912.1 hypothetical protein L0Z11_16210 [Burkholderia multivorans]